MTHIIKHLNKSFEVEEIREQSKKDHLKGKLETILIYFLILFSPFILLYNAIKNLGRKNNDSWELIADYQRRKIFKLPILNESEFPQDLDYYTKIEDIVLLYRLRFEPSLPELESKYFYEDILDSGSSLYFLSYNHKEEGMTLYYQDSSYFTPIEVLRVKSQYWELKELPFGTMQINLNKNKFNDTILVKKL